MDKHVRITAYANIVLGVAGLVAAVVVLLTYGGFSGILGLNAEEKRPLLEVTPLESLVGAAFTGFLLLVSPLLVAGGIGLLGLQGWARWMLTIVSALNLLHVPLGTALGIYSLSILLSEETEFLFSHPPPRYTAER